MKVNEPSELNSAMPQFIGGFIPITPTHPVHLAGYGARQEPFTGVSDDLEANAVVIRDTDRSLVLVTLDLLYVGAYLRQRLEAALQPFVGADDLFLAASHTHFAPATDPSLPRLGVMDADYVGLVVTRVEILVRDLFRGEFKPLYLGVGRAQADNAVNRRRIGWRICKRFPFLRHGVSMAANPRGNKDDTVTLLRLGSDAVIWHYACHPVFVPQLNHVSADFVGFVRRSLRAKLGPKTAVLFWQGFSGDVYPSFATTMTGLAASLKRRWRRSSGQVEPHIWTRWAERLASHVETAFARAKLDRSTGPLQSIRVACPINDLLADGASDKILWAHRIQLGPEIDILGISAEPVTAYGEFFRNALGSPHLLCIGCIDGVFGYLPTAPMLHEGGYEAVDFFPAFSLQGRFRDDPEKVLQTRLVAPLIV